MKVRNIAVLFVLFLVAMFAAANWVTFAQPTKLNLLLGAVEAPLGLVMLIVLVALTLLYGVFLATLETRMLLESRRQAKVLEESSDTGPGDREFAAPRPSAISHQRVGRDQGPVGRCFEATAIEEAWQSRGIRQRGVVSGWILDCRAPGNSGFSRSFEKPSSICSAFGPLAPPSIHSTVAPRRWKPGRVK